MLVQYRIVKKKKSYNVSNQENIIVSEDWRGQIEGHLSWTLKVWQQEEKVNNCISRRGNHNKKSIEVICVTTSDGHE